MPGALKRRRDPEEVSLLKINVALPNGHAELLTLPPSSTVQDLRTKAQRAFGKNSLRLITAENRVLVNFDQTLEEAQIKDGECLTALVLRPQLAATRSAFALWHYADGTIVTWGKATDGGDSSAVAHQLEVANQGVQQIKATSRAFALILEDRSVITWGHQDDGGRPLPLLNSAQRNNDIDSSSEEIVVENQFPRRLRYVQQIQATSRAFAAILPDGSVLTWGDLASGGDLRAVRDQLRGVHQIEATSRAFAAILEDRSVVTWGDEVDGGDSSAVRDRLMGVQQI